MNKFAVCTLYRCNGMYGLERKKECFWLDGLLVVCLGCGLHSRPKPTALAAAHCGLPVAAMHWDAGNVTCLLTVSIHPQVLALFLVETLQQKQHLA